MVVKTIQGSTVSLVHTDKRSLFESDGTEWARCPEFDVKEPYGVAYRETKENMAVVRLTRDEIKRVINGTHAMRTPTTVEEMRYHALTLPNEYQWIIDQWPDQKLREILIEAEEKNHNPGAMLEAKAYAIILAEEAAKEQEQAEQEDQEKAPPKPEKTHPVPGGHRSTPKRRTQEGSVSVASGDISVTLTPKQLEFMERLSECPGWKDTGVTGEYVASQYAEELSDTMNPMSMGAVLTTMREKGILSTRKARMGGIKCCIFQLTEVGIAVYKELAGGRG